MNVVETRHLTIRYQAAEALSDVSFSVEAGDYVGLVGPNGSGKTTLVRGLLRLVDEQEGEALLFGKKAAELSDWGRVGYLPQKAAVMDARFPATVREVIASGLLVRRPFPKVLTPEDKKEIQGVLDLLGISGIAQRPIGELSGGQQQRVLLARALAHRPDLLVLDEPTVALDPQTREVFYAALQHLNRDHKVTVLLVSHDISTIGQYASKLLYLDRKVVFYGKFDEFCGSEVMGNYFGKQTQHVTCHRH